MATQNQCAQCNQPASQVCNGCVDAPDIGANITMGKTYYCNSECQRANWSSHKSACKRLQIRKVFYRAASTLQKMFYVYREEFFEKTLTKVEEKDGKLYIYETMSSSLMLIAFDALTDFPGHLLMSEDDKKSVLSFSASGTAVGWMHNIIEYMLADIVSEVTESTVVPKNPMREMSNVGLGQEMRNDREHEVLKVTLKDGGEQYALDLAGAQYGYYAPVIPWEEYVEARVENFIDRPGFQYFGGYEKWIRSNLPQEDDWHFGALNKGLDQIHIVTSQALKKGTQKWEHIQKMSVQRLLRLPAADFEVKHKELIQFVRSAAAFGKKFIGEKLRDWARGLKTEEGILLSDLDKSLFEG